MKTIAIFGMDPHTTKLTPLQHFKVIRDINSIRGYKFESVILCEQHRWSDKIWEAYNELRLRQPELFLTY